MMAPSRRLLTSVFLLAITITLLAVWSLQSGAVTLNFAQVFHALTGSAPRNIIMVVTEWRLPRVAMAILVGAALGVSGAIFQSLMRNPLGSPDVMGLNTGAWSGVLVAMVLVRAASDGHYLYGDGGRHSDLAAYLGPGLAQRH